VRLEKTNTLERLLCTTKRWANNKMLNLDVVDEPVPGGEAWLVAARPVAHISMRRLDMGFELFVR
jgi:hypothetical protein